ncbi:MAG: hypothetical protein ACT4OZ_10165 [Gemmatimonadota bacterium]
MKGLVSEFLIEKKKADDEAARAAAPRKKSPVGGVIATVLCATVWLAPVPEGSVDPFTDPVATGNAARAGLGLLASQVVDYQRSHGRLPRSLAEAGIEDSVSYLAAGRSFTLSVALAGTTFSHSTTMDTLSADSSSLR